MLLSYPDMPGLSRGVKEVTTFIYEYKGTKREDIGVPNCDLELYRRWLIEKDIKTWTEVHKRI